MAVGDGRVQTGGAGLELVFDQDDGVAQFVAALLPIAFSADDFGPCTTIGIQDRGTKQLIGGAVYHRWRGFDCELTFAATSPRWCRRGVLTALFHYPFIQRACTRMTLLIGRNNERALKLNIGLGFEVEGVHPRAYDGVNDAVSLGMLREKCKWVKGFVQ